MGFAGRCAIVVFVLCDILVSSAAQATSGWMERPGSVKYALSQADGSHIYLDAVKVNKIRAQQTPSYFVVSEFFSYHDTLITLTLPNALLRRGQTVDIEGDLTTLDSGDRALTSVTVWGYTDSAGNLLYNGPLLKGLLEPTPWQWKTDLTVSPPIDRQEPDSMQQSEVSADTPSEVLVCSSIAEVKSQDPGTVVELRCKPVSTGGSEAFTLGEDDTTDTITTNYTGNVDQTDRVCTLRGTVDTDGEGVVLDVDSGPNYNVQESYQGSLLAAHQGTILWAKSQYNATQVSLAGKIITRVWPDYFYIEEDDRFSGIRVQMTNHGHYSGERVSVSGTMATNIDNERYIAATSATHVEDANLNPVGMSNKLLGGGDVGYIAGNPASGQKGTIGGVGLNNIGVLVKTWGRIAEIDSAGSPQWFRISDGSGYQTTIAYPPYGYALNNFVGIAGISSCEKDANSDLQRVVRPQPLKVTINQAAGQTDPATSLPINFTVVFSEPVTGFTADDIAIGGSAGGTKTVTVTPGDSTGKQYNVAVNNLTYGTAIATIAAARAVNASAVWNYASTSTDNQVSYGGNIVYVQMPANGGSDSNSGWSWNNAKATITAALQTSVSYGATQVWVAKGTYNEKITVPLGKELYGGFVGNETSLSQRPAFQRQLPDAKETVIDGGKQGSVVTLPSGATSLTKVDGFTIRNGTGTPSGNYAYGGGVYCPSGAPVIANNRIIWNVVSGGLYNLGGGIYCGSGAPTIANNVVSGNETNDSGGGIYTLGGTISNNVVMANGAPSGGGIYTEGIATIVNNTVVANDGREGGGIGCASGSLVKGNIIAYNCSGIMNFDLDNGLTMSYNCVYGNRFYDCRSVTLGAGNLSVDPKLAGINSSTVAALQSLPNAHIQNDSPCRDAITDGTLRDAVDIDGQSRAADNYADIGADESYGTSYGATYPAYRVIGTAGNDNNDGSGWDSSHAMARFKRRSIALF